MKLTKEEAVRLFHEQWSDMQKELGDCPSYRERLIFKRDWCEKRFPGETICAYCFLCEYMRHKASYSTCNFCPIVWPLDECSSSSIIGTNWRLSPISEILALPIREED